MLKSMLVNKDFQTWHLIGWQHSRQPIKSHIRKPLLTDMEFNMDFAYQPPTQDISSPGSDFYFPEYSGLASRGVKCMGADAREDGLDVPWHENFSL